MPGTVGGNICLSLTRSSEAEGYFPLVSIFGINFSAKPFGDYRCFYHSQSEIDLNGNPLGMLAGLLQFPPKRNCDAVSRSKRFVAIFGDVFRLCCFPNVRLSKRS